MQVAEKERAFSLSSLFPLLFVLSFALFFRRLNFLPSSSPRFACRRCLPLNLFSLSFVQNPKTEGKGHRIASDPSWCPSLLAHLLLSPAPRDRLDSPSAPGVRRVRQGDEREARRAPKPLGEREPFSFFFFSVLKHLSSSFFSPRSRSLSPFLRLVFSSCPSDDNGAPSWPCRNG